MDDVLVVGVGHGEVEDRSQQQGGGEAEISSDVALMRERSLACGLVVSHCWTAGWENALCWIAKRDGLIAFFVSVGEVVGVV